ncbi:hypothetical protein PFISCL1PPCAC_2936, partial [Pristionchus fissidentatus]
FCSKSMLLRVLQLLLLVNAAAGARILFINTWHSKSHQGTMKNVMEKLVQRNHSVAILNLAFSDLGPAGKGVEVITNVVSTKDIQFEMSGVADLFWNEEMSAWTYSMPCLIANSFLEFSVESEALKKVFSIPWDVALVDELFPIAGGAISEVLNRRYGTKSAIYATTEFYDMWTHHRGLGRNPVVVPNHYVRGYNLQSRVDEFYYRLKQTKDALVEIIWLPLVDYVHTVGASPLDVELTLSKLYERALITITDFPRSLRRPTTTDHRVVSTGESCKDASSLEESYKKFVEDPKSKGTIYVAFGSLVQWDSGPRELPEVFIRAFNQLSDYRIIWTYNGRPLEEKLGDHILITKWAPQNDLLAHKNTKMFVTHGGLKSIKEGICSSVPLLMMPFFADQMMIAATAVEKGLALNIYKKNATETEIVSKIRQVLDRSKEMKINVAKYRSIFLDNIIDPVLEGALRIERLVRVDEDKYRSYTQTKGGFQSWLQFLYADVVIIPLALVYALSK